MKRFLPLLVLAPVLGCKSGPEVRRGPAFDVFPAARTEVAFAPPLGQHLKERSLTQRTDKVSGTTSKSIVELFTETSWAHDTDAFVLSQRVTSVSALQNDKKIDDPLATLVTKFPTKFSVAKDGTFLRFLNPEDVQKAVAESYPDPEQQAQVLAFFTPAAIEDQARVEWEQKYQGMFGRAVEATRPVYVVDGTAVGQVPVLFVVERTLTGTAKTPYGEAAVFTLKCVQRPEDAKDKAGYEALLSERGNPTLESTASCEGRQVVAREKFVPVAMELRIKAKPVTDGVEVGELELLRQTTAEELK